MKKMQFILFFLLFIINSEIFAQNFDLNQELNSAITKKQSILSLKTNGIYTFAPTSSSSGVQVYCKKLNIKKCSFANITNQCDPNAKLSENVPYLSCEECKKEGADVADKVFYWQIFNEAEIIRLLIVR